MMDDRRTSTKELSKNALRVLEKRYLLTDELGKVVETAEGLFRRVAKALSSIESRFGMDAVEIADLEEEFFRVMNEHKFLPNSPTLMNAGKKCGQLSACFVLPVPDSLEGIFDTCKNAALIHKTGGGTGFAFSRLRPLNDPVSSSVGVASGPVSFMTVYDAATEAIRQGGTRRGANMGILRIDHPDIEQFITCKRETSRLNNFNISVAVTDEFMQAVSSDGDFDLVHPGTGEVVRTVKAKHLFDLIVENAHATGEPGIVFIDRINALDPLFQALDENGQVLPGTEDIEATNPCGEQPLGPGDACNLGSINVSEFVDENGSDFNWTELAHMVQIAVRFLDDVIEANHYPMPFIEKAAKGNRRIGVGVMGLAEALIKMNIVYDSETAIRKAEELMSFIQRHAHEASGRLAVERGNFPNWAHSKWHKMNVPMRNATVTAIAPTGTISIIAGTSSGIEPLFAVCFIRRVLGGEELIEVNELFEAIARKRGFYSEDLMRQIAATGTLENVQGVPDDVKRLFVCSHDIDYSWHLKMQAAFQKYTDSGVSKTINFAHHATNDNVREAYLKSWDLGLKGVTVYRDQSRPAQVLNLGLGSSLPHGNKRFCAPGEECDV
ncbi:MAG: adenosylcobalamin-dependent ribonucleoside-diphosphate reductase [Candidatus Obscuribacterales bacterium]|nr:adenosylcobalamin-dependent ribonucleoside-diphosphate reductase [Candidatus Obscuribacterales bacterium]